MKADATNVAMTDLITSLTMEVSYGNVSPGSVTRSLHVFIYGMLQAGWDEADALRVLEQFPDHGYVVQAFRGNEIYLPCGAHEVLEDGGEEGGNWGIWVTCVLPKDHTVDHFDDNEDLTWPVTKP